MMPFTFVTRLALLALFHHVNANPLVRQSRLTRQCTVSSFSGAVTPNGVSINVEKVVAVAESGSYGEGPVDKVYSSLDI
jgi:hypothetical protein